MAAIKETNREKETVSSNKGDTKKETETVSSSKGDKQKQSNSNK